jgi:hypothetical protein
MQRPLAHGLAVGLLAILWLGLIGGIVLVWRNDAAPFEIFAGVFWSSVWYFWLARVWLGGPMAIGLMRKALFAICPIMIGGSAIAIGITGGKVYPSQLIGVAAALCGIAGGVLLGREDVKRWSQSTVQAKVLHQPPDGTAFDLRATALRQNRGMFGCLMIVIAAVVLIVVGVIGEMLPEDRGVNAPDYIAFMVGVVLVVAIGIAGYIRIDLQAKAMGVLTVTERGIQAPLGRPVIRGRSGDRGRGPQVPGGAARPVPLRRAGRAPPRPAQRRQPARLARGGAGDSLPRRRVPRLGPAD